MIEQQMQKETKRDNYLDIIKGIAIFLVVFAHSIQFGSGIDFLGGTLFYDNSVFTIINSFHMPLFMLISGYLCNVNKYSLCKGIGDKFKKLIVPIFAWQGILYFAKYLYHIKSANLLSYLSEFVRDSFTSIWFLWAVFFSSTIVIVVNKIFKDSVIVYLIIFISTFFLINEYSAHCFMFPFFIMGYFYKKNKLRIDNMFLSFRLISKIIVSIVIYLILMLFYNYRDYLDGYSLWNKDVRVQISINIYRISVGLMGSIFVLLLIKMILRYSNNLFGQLLTESFKKLGQFSFGIYIVSGYLNEYILWKITKEFHLNYFIALVQTLIIINISCLVIFILRKNKVIRNIFLGGR